MGDGRGQVWTGWVGWLGVAAQGGGGGGGGSRRVRASPPILGQFLCGLHWSTAALAPHPSAPSGPAPEKE